MAGSDMGHAAGSSGEHQPTPEGSDVGHATAYFPPPDPGHGGAEWDDGQCPECQAGTLVAWVNGVAYRHCSYVHCDWGIRSDVIVTPQEATR